MSVTSDIVQHIHERRLRAAYDAELIARSREILARTKALLEEPLPTIFLGAQHHSLTHQEEQGRQLLALSGHAFAPAHVRF